jgi:hypothetical protein
MTEHIDPLKAEFITQEEMVPGRQFEFMGYSCWWTGWKQMYNQLSIAGQWIALDPKTQHTYYYSLPGHAFGSGIYHTVFDLTVRHVPDSLQVVIDRSFRNQLIRQGRRTFKKMINEAERKNVMKALEETSAKVYGGQKIANPSTFNPSTIPWNVLQKAIDADELTREKLRLYQEIQNNKRFPTVEDYKKAIAERDAKQPGQV